MKLLRMLLSAVCVIVPLALSAQEIDTTQFYVSDVLFARPSYVANETVTGTFVFHNLSTQTVTNAKYRIELVELLDDGNGVYPSDALDASASVPLAIAAPGSQEVSFSYQLPAHLPDLNLGILVQTYIGDANTPAALEYVPIILTGERVTYMERTATVVVNDEEFYDPLAGPTVESNETVSIEVYLRNTTSEVIEFQPLLRIVSGNTSTGTNLITEQVPTVQIAANAEQTVTVPLPLSALEPGVYTVLVSATNVQNGTPVFAPVETRIVIGGLTPKIEHVTYNTFNLTPADASFDVRVTYLEPPVNFRAHADGTPKDNRVTWAAEEMSVEEWVRAMNVTARVAIKNAETGELLQQQELPFTSSNTVTVPFGRITGVSNVEVITTLLQKGNEIDTFTETVTLITEEYVGWKKLWTTYPLVILGSGIALLCVGVLLAGILILRRRNKRVLENQIIG